jgi:hypothetical protein
VCATFAIKVTAHEENPYQPGSTITAIDFKQRPRGARVCDDNSLAIDAIVVDE